MNIRRIREATRSAQKRLLHMESIFFTLQDFFAFTKGVIYILIIAILFAMLGFWRFLTSGNED